MSSQMTRTLRHWVSEQSGSKKIGRCPFAFFVSWKFKRQNFVKALEWCYGLDSNPSPLTRFLIGRHIFPTVGLTLVGKMTIEEVTVDNKGRVLIPKEARDKVGLQAGGKARLKIEQERIIIMPPISPEEFIREMEGCIREGAPTLDPLDLKKMWEPMKKQT